MYSGCAMTLQGSSLPASGGEHLISHTLDMRAHGRRRHARPARPSGRARDDLRGRAVRARARAALAALFGRSRCRSTARAGAAPRTRSPRITPSRARAWRLACERLAQGDTWSRVRAQLAPMLTERAPWSRTCSCRPTPRTASPTSASTANASCGRCATARRSANASRRSTSPGSRACCPTPPRRSSTQYLIR